MTTSLPTSKNNILSEIKTFGLLTVYRKSYLADEYEREFVVGHQDGRLLEEFHHLRTACHWAKANQHG